MIELNEDYFEEFKGWISIFYPNLDPYFIFYEDEENEMIINEFLETK